MGTTLNDGELVLTNTALVVDVENIATLSNDEYIMARRSGLGTSDSATLLGVNPYSNLTKLMESKLLTDVSTEERAVGELTAVKKGRDLEPLILTKFSEHFGMPAIKPIHQYAHKDFPYLKFNFDGVTGTPQQYIPAEAKVVTKAGERHYNYGKAIFTEKGGLKPMPDDVTNFDLTIEQKAAFYGMPPYYYTQLQQQILGLKAPYGYLVTLTESIWALTVYMAWADSSVHKRLILEGGAFWNKIEQMKKHIL